MFIDRVRYFDPENKNYNHEKYLNEYTNQDDSSDYHMYNPKYVNDKNITGYNYRQKIKNNNDNENSFSYKPRDQSRWNPDFLSMVNNAPENAPRVSDVLPDIIHYPGVYPVFNPYSFYPWFAHYWDLYEKEFEDLVERREKYELFKDLLRQEEHEYLHINKPKEKYRAVNHLLGSHKKIIDGIDDYTYKNKKGYNGLVKLGDKDKNVDKMWENDMKYVSNIGGQGKLNDVFIYGAEKGAKPLYKHKDNNFKDYNASDYEKATNFGKEKNNLSNSMFLTPILDRHMNYESYKFDNGFKRIHPTYESKDTRLKTDVLLLRNGDTFTKENDFNSEDYKGKSLYESSKFNKNKRENERYLNKEIF